MREFPFASCGRWKCADIFLSNLRYRDFIPVQNSMALSSKITGTTLIRPAKLVDYVDKTLADTTERTLHDTCYIEIV